MSIYTIRTERTFADKPGWRVCTRYLPEDRDSIIHGLMPKGWRWHYETAAPNGEVVGGQVHGPYETQAEALAAAGWTYPDPS